MSKVQTLKYEEISQPRFLNTLEKEQELNPNAQRAIIIEWLRKWMANEVTDIMNNKIVWNLKNRDIA